MEGRNKVLITFIFLIFLVVVFYIFAEWFSKTTGYSVGNSPETELSKCLSQKGAKFYTSNSCPECAKQKTIFGSVPYNSLTRIDCAKKPLECSNLQSLPAWNINGQVYYGVKTLNELKYLSGCLK